MNRQDRAKAEALGKCLMWSDFDRTFIQGLAWCARHYPEKALSKSQRYSLDLLVFKYRAQLGGRLPPELMLAVPPEKADYGIKDEPPMIRDLFTGQPSPPHETEDHAIPDHCPQRDLF